MTLKGWRVVKPQHNQSRFSFFVDIVHTICIHWHCKRLTHAQNDLGRRYPHMILDLGPFRNVASQNIATNGKVWCNWYFRLSAPWEKVSSGYIIQRETAQINLHIYLVWLSHLVFLVNVFNKEFTRTPKALIRLPETAYAPNALLFSESHIYI